MPKRDFSKFEDYLNILEGDIYAQPPDEAHTAWAIDFIEWLSKTGSLEPTMRTLDVGCGQGFTKEVLIEKLQAIWQGVTLGEDYEAIKDWPEVSEQDMSFMDFQDGEFDMVYARHVLEHSPFPLLTLMEWYRVSSKWLALVVPAPEFWGYRGRNHYSVMNQEHLRWILARAGWIPVAEQQFTVLHSLWREYNPEVVVNRPTSVEYRLLCLKGVPVKQ